MTVNVFENFAENTTNEKVFGHVYVEIWKSWHGTCVSNKNHPQAKEVFNPDKLPIFHDPFADGVTILLGGCIAERYTILYGYLLYRYRCHGAYPDP